MGTVWRRSCLGYFVVAAFLSADTFRLALLHPTTQKLVAKTYHGASSSQRPAPCDGRNDSGMSRRQLATSLLVFAPAAHAESSRAVLTVPALNYEFAAVVMEAAVLEARNHKWPVSIVVADVGGVPLASSRLDAFPASLEIAMGKARTAAMFRKDTADLEESVNANDSKGRSALLSAPYILMGGCVPIIVDNVCVGSIGVSGVKPEQDAQVAKAGVTAVLASFSKT
eukprot:TRINITY_DN49919_c0_g1_i1.p1 TRINITY_DN49919_c0_g1~~TRINITY_DN49919_c0_g1_i1.p1  ORF type:complete len:226 (+),score=30.69 TRINITY_DN49919_c0_g1_i1:31-708(+)